MFQDKAIYHAVLSVVEIAKRRAAGQMSGVQAHDAAEAYGLSTAHTAKVMGQLARSRILRSVRGPQGGFQLTRDANQVTLLEVFEAVQGVVDGRLDAEQSEAPDDVRAGLADVYGKATDKLRQVLTRMTVDKFVKTYCK